MSSALITACNNALAQIAAGQIAALTENSIEARECNRFGPQLLEEMADWTPWRALRKRVTLAETTNDRPAEWLYAYQAPSDLGDPIAIRGVEEDAVDLPTFGPYPFPVQNAVPLAFLYEGAMIYSNVPDAVLVYSSSTLEASQLSPLMRRAFELELAARIALPIKKDVKLAGALQQQAEVARQRAIADEENKVQSHPPRYVSEVEYARAGVGV
jgi:hypothetical protein